MLKAKISEIFCSVQGEGKYAGVRQVFIRFFGCQLDCAWCDTAYARQGPAEGSFQELGRDEVLAQAGRLWAHCHSVSLTGGKPLLQKDFIKTILPEIRRAGLLVYLDTNGVDPQALAEVIAGIDIVAMDIKLPSSAKCPSLWDEHRRFLRVAAAKDVFAKVVITPDTEKEDVVRAVLLVADVNPAITLILQPDSDRLAQGSALKCMEFQNYCLEHLSDVRMIPQMHKLMDLR